MAKKHNINFELCNNLKDAVQKIDKNIKNKMQYGQQLEQLTQEAKRLGATSSSVILSKEIQVKDELAALCNGDYSCPYYGLAASCPPHVGGPAEFKKWQAQSEYSVSVRIELPTIIMFSDERKTIMQSLHHIVATIERMAIEIGFNSSKGFAGGSCRELFCGDQEKCAVVAENAPCHHIDSARPSLSGFGIDATLLMKLSGWPAPIAKKSDVTDKAATSWLAGLILLA